LYGALGCMRKLQNPSSASIHWWPHARHEQHKPSTDQAGTQHIILTQKPNWGRSTTLPVTACSHPGAVQHWSDMDAQNCV